jgi:CRP-like cAMP-binding protein
MRVFGHVRARDVRSLASPVLKVVVAAGTGVISEHDEVGTFFVIRAGTAELSRDGIPVSALGPGDCFGESDPRAPQPQPFTVTATTELTLLTFSAEGIARLCGVIPGARERIRRYLPAPIYVLPPPERSRSAAASSTVIAR